MDGLDPVIHVPARLRILATLVPLAAGDFITFARLRQHLDLTAGNLITHLRKLEEVGYISSGKNGGTTTVALTEEGRSAFARYRTTLAQLLVFQDPTPEAAPVAGVSSANLDLMS